MTEAELEKFNINLAEMIGPECGFFGRIYTWGQGSTEYKYVGYIFSEDFLPTLKQISPEQRKLLAMIMIYFEMHMRPLKRLLEREKESLYNFYSDHAWSHFATVVMFGMLEIAVKRERGVWLKSKGARIREFLENHLPTETKEDITKRYKVEELFAPKKPITDFGSVVDHMWEEVRGGFVHDAGIQSRGMEWTTLKGLGSKDDPIRINSDVPMQEWLQLTWQAILNSLGYKGRLELPRYDRGSKSVQGSVPS